MGGRVQGMVWGVGGMTGVGAGITSGGMCVGQAVSGEGQPVIDVGSLAPPLIPLPGHNHRHCLVPRHAVPHIHRIASLTSASSIFSLSGGSRPNLRCLINEA